MVLWLRHRRLLWSILVALATLLLTLLLTGRQTRPTVVGGELSSPGTVIVLDAGHGGEDGGAVSPDGVPESGINLQIVRKAEGLLVFLGRSVRLTRTGGGGHLFSGGPDPAGEESIGPEEPCGAYQRPAPCGAAQHPSEQYAPAPRRPRGAGLQQSTGACRRAGAIHPAGAESDSKHRKRKRPPRP